MKNKFIQDVFSSETFTLDKKNPKIEFTLSSKDSYLLIKRIHLNTQNEVNNHWTNIISFFELKAELKYIVYVDPKGQFIDEETKEFTIPLLFDLYQIQPIINLNRRIYNNVILRRSPKPKFYTSLKLELTEILDVDTEYSLLFEVERFNENTHTTNWEYDNVIILLGKIISRKIRHEHATNCYQTYMEMNSQLILSKIEILKLKLQAAELQNELVQMVQKQNYEASLKLKEKWSVIYSQIGIIKTSFQDQLRSLERSPLNYPLIHEIHTILLEFNEENLEFRVDFFNEMNQRYDDLGIKWKALQLNGNFKQAKEVNTERVDIGKFIGKIPN